MSTTRSCADQLADARNYADNANLGKDFRSVMFGCGRHAMLCIARRFYREALGLPSETRSIRVDLAQALMTEQPR